MRRLALAAAILLMAGGCGGDDDDQPTRSVTLSSGAALRVKAHEYRFNPNKVVVDAAGPLRIELENDGDLAHNVRLRRDGEEVGGTPSLPGGRTGSARVELEPGDYELLCTVGDHAELGMTGTLKVR